MKERKEPWRIAAFAISVLYIAYLWGKKDIAALYATVPTEQMLPLMVTTIAVSLIKIAALAAGILLLKFLAGKVGKK